MHEPDTAILGLFLDCSQPGFVPTYISWLNVDIFVICGWIEPLCTCGDESNYSKCIFCFSLKSLIVHIYRYRGYIWFVDDHRHSTLGSPIGNSYLTIWKLFECSYLYVISEDALVWYWRSLLAWLLRDVFPSSWCSYTVWSTVFRTDILNHISADAIYFNIFHMLCIFLLKICINVMFLTICFGKPNKARFKKKKFKSNRGACGCVSGQNSCLS